MIEKTTKEIIMDAWKLGSLEFSCPMPLSGQHNIILDKVDGQVWILKEDLINFIDTVNWYYKVGKTKIWQASNDEVVSLVINEIISSIQENKDKDGQFKS